MHTFIQKKGLIIIFLMLREKNKFNDDSTFEFFKGDEYFPN